VLTGRRRLSSGHGRSRRTQTASGDWLSCHSVPCGEAIAARESGDRTGSFCPSPLTLRRVSSIPPFDKDRDHLQFNSVSRAPLHRVGRDHHHGKRGDGCAEIALVGAIHDRAKQRGWPVVGFRRAFTQLSQVCHGWATATGNTSQSQHCGWQSFQYGRGTR